MLPNARPVTRRLRVSVAGVVAAGALLGLAGCGTDPVRPSAPDDGSLAVSAARGGAKAAPTSGYVTGADGVQLHYQVRGHGPDTIVVLHGGPGLSASYLIDDLSKLEPSRTLIYYDQRGGGLSDLPAPSLLTADRMVADLEALRQHFGLERLTLMGNSWGGALAALYTISHPDRVARMVLLGPAPSSSSIRVPERAGIFARFSEAELAALIALNQQLAVAPDAQTAALCEQTFAYVFARYQFRAASLADMRGRWCSGSPAAMRYGNFVTGGAVVGSLGASYDIPAALAQALAGRQVPTLVIEGTASPFVASARAYAAAIPGAQLELIENAGHFPWLEEPHAFFHTVRQFLQRTKHLVR
jgi:proline iminopeptidase